MNKQVSKQEKIIFLLLKNLLPFLSGTLMALIFFQMAEFSTITLLSVIFKLLGYATYCYLATPFILYWLGYASMTKLTKETIIMTICLVGIYSYVLWDSYFFFKQTMQLLFVDTDYYSYINIIDFDRIN